MKDKIVKILLDCNIVIWGGYVRDFLNNEISNDGDIDVLYNSKNYVTKFLDKIISAGFSIKEEPTPKPVQTEGSENNNSYSKIIKESVVPLRRFSIDDGNQSVQVDFCPEPIYNLDFSVNSLTIENFALHSIVIGQLSNYENKFSVIETIQHIKDRILIPYDIEHLSPRRLDKMKLKGYKLS